MYNPMRIRPVAFALVALALLLACRLWLSMPPILPGEDRETAREQTTRAEPTGQTRQTAPEPSPAVAEPPPAARAYPTIPAGAGILPPAPPPATPTIAILASTPHETLAEIRFPEPILTPVEHRGRQAVRIALAGCRELKGVDQPALPVRRWEMALPGDALASVEIVALDSYTVPSDPPLPSGGFGLRNRPRPVGDFGYAYDSPAPYPQEIARLSPSYRIRQIEGTGLVVHPVRYLPDAASLEIVRAIQVRLRHEPNTPTGTLRYPGPPHSRAFRTLAASRFANYQETIAGEEDETNTRGTGGSLGGTDRLLVVLPDEWDGMFGDFLDWKRQRGLDILTARYPADTGSGTAALANHIQTAYDNQQIAYVILLGDETRIPVGTGSQANTPSDTIYTLVDGDDDYHDLLLSRVPFPDAAQVETTLGKLLAYEREPNTATGWRNRVAMVASNEANSPVGSVYRGMADNQILDNLRERLLDSGSYDWADQIYQGTSDGTTAKIASSWNGGRSLFYYLGHGQTQNWSSVSFTTTHAADLNNASALPFVVSAACKTGGFHNTATSLAEAMLWGRQQDGTGGAAAVIASTTDMGWDPPIAMVEAFTGYYLGESEFPVGHLQPTDQPLLWDAGGLTFASIQRAMDYCASASTEGQSPLRLIMQQTHLFGDATLGVRTTDPRNLLVEHPEFVHLTDGLAVSVSCAGRGPLAGATVTLTDGEGNLSTTITDAEGAATVSPGPFPPGSHVTLTVYERDAIPHQTAGLQIGDSLAILGPDTLPAAFVDEPYTHAFTAVLGNPPYLWTQSGGELPPGISLAPDGTLSGTPAETGSHAFTVRVTDSLDDTAERAVSWSVARAVQVGDQTLEPATVGTAYSATVAATGTLAPFTYSLLDSPPPPGLALAADGSIAGTPSRHGTYTFAVQATDTGNRSDQGDITISVLPAEEVFIETETLADAVLGYPYSVPFAASGGSGGGYVWAIGGGALPEGLVLAPGGLLAGTPSASGTAHFTVQVSDDAEPPRSATRDFALSVGEPVAIAATAMPHAVAGIPYHETIPATGSYLPFTFAIGGGEEYSQTQKTATFAEDGTLQEDWYGDEIHHDLDLGFAFPYFGQTYTTCRVGDNGYLIFGDQAPAEGPNGTCWNAVPGRLDDYRIVAPFWADLVIETQYPDTGIWLDRQSDAITIRWRGRDFEDENLALNFAVTLHASGQITFQYGTIQTNNRIVVGMGNAGDHTRILLFSQGKGGTGAPAWSEAENVVFTPLGILPPGLTLAADGTLSGTPLYPGAFSLTVLATDSQGFGDLANLTLEVRPNTPADTDGDGDVDNGEILAFIARWHAGEVTETDVEQAVEAWRQGPPAPRRGTPPTTNERTRIQVDFGTRDTLDRIIDQGIIVASVQDGTAWLHATAEERAWLESLGLLCIASPHPPGRSTPTTYDDLVDQMAELASTYPAICRMEQIGLSVDGRSILALALSDQPHATTEKPKTRIVGGIHGDERLSVTIPLRLAQWLLENYGGTDPDGNRATELLDDLEIWILPLLNPDGYEAGKRTNTNLVDLNRNFPDGIDGTVGNAHQEGAPDTAGRQPETAAFMAWTAAHRFVLGANLHTGAKLVCYPYGNHPSGSTTYSAAPDDALFIDLSQTYADLHPTLSTVINSCEWYRVVGELPDWAYRYTGTLEITVELDVQPAPPEEPAWQDNRESLLAFLEYARRNIRGTVRDTHTGLPLNAAIAIDGNEREVYTEPATGSFHRVLLPGTYGVAVSAPGYLTQSFHAIPAGTRLEVELEAILDAHRLDREFATPLYRPENENTIRLFADIDAENQPQAFLVSETLPDGWAFLPGSAFDLQTGDSLADPRREGNTLSWLFWRDDVHDQAFAYRAHAPAIRAETAPFGGNLRTIAGTIPAAGDTLWQARTANRTALAAPAGWSLLSLPLNPDRNPLPDLVSQHGVTIWAWEPTALRYVVPGQLAAKEGYWLHAPAPFTLIIEGQPPEHAERDFAPGWNLFGPLADRELLDEPFLESQTIEWEDQTYRQASALQAGKAYWIRASAPGRAALQ